MGVTLEELDQLYHLRREIEMDRRRLDELRAQAAASKIKTYVAGVVDLMEIVSDKHRRCIRERDRLERFIADIDDGLIRQIFRLRFGDGLQWEDVARRISYQYSGKYVANLCYRYLENSAKT